jgi:hypothetical protein
MLSWLFTLFYRAAMRRAGWVQAADSEKAIELKTVLTASQNTSEDLLARDKLASAQHEISLHDP